MSGRPFLFISLGVTPHWSAKGGGTKKRWICCVYSSCFSTFASLPSKEVESHFHSRVAFLPSLRGSRFRPFHSRLRGRRPFFAFLRSCYTVRGKSRDRNYCFCFFTQPQRLSSLDLFLRLCTCFESKLVSSSFFFFS